MRGKFSRRTRMLAKLERIILESAKLAKLMEDLATDDCMKRQMQIDNKNAAKELIEEYKDIFFFRQKKKLLVAKKEYSCFECDKSIPIGEHYYLVQRNCCSTEEYSKLKKKHDSLSKVKAKWLFHVCPDCKNRATHVDVKLNPLSYQGRVKIEGSAFGIRWSNVEDELLGFYHENLQECQYYDEIEEEFKKRGLDTPQSQKTTYIGEK